MTRLFQRRGYASHAAAPQYVRIVVAGLLLSTFSIGQVRAERTTRNHLRRSVRALGLTARTFTHGTLKSHSSGGKAMVHLVSSQRLTNQVHLLPEMGGITPQVRIEPNTKMSIEYNVDAQGLSSAVLTFTKPVELKNATSVARGAISEAKSLLGRAPRAMAGLGRMGLGIAGAFGVQKASFEQITVSRKADGRFETHLDGKFPMLGKRVKLPAVELPGIIGSIVAVAQEGTRGEFTFQSNGRRMSGEILPEGGEGGLRWMVEPMMAE